MIKQDCAIKKVKPHNPKYYDFYMSIAQSAANESVAVKRKVGAAIILPSGLIATGWNGMPAGFNNVCEWQCEDAKGYDTGRTKPEVIHAERNALDKLCREGVSPEGAILFTTTAPCIECAKSIAAVGIVSVIFETKFTSDAGIDFLIKSGIKVESFFFFKTHQ
jgi:dCMP deaminase